MYSKPSKHSDIMNVKDSGMDTNELIIKAYAKINIGLQVLSRRSDGYHNINSCITRICLADEIRLSEDKKLSVVCKPSLNIPQEKNLAHIAATMTSNYYCISDKGANIEIIKKIPIGAGLGGGSSDAASTIVGLRKLWNIKKGFGDDEALCESLGSDVPYFMNDRTALAKGRGDVLEYFDYRLPYWLLLIYPGIEISTTWAYNNLERNGEYKIRLIDFKSLLIQSLSKPEILNKYFVNDFESVVFNDYPQLEKIKSNLNRDGAIFASLSGSGSSVYGFFNSKKDCEEAALFFSDYQTFICQPQVN